MRIRRICWAVPFAMLTVMLSSVAVAQMDYRQVYEENRRAEDWARQRNHDLEQMERANQMTPPYGGFEQGTPLDPEAAALQREQEESEGGAGMLKTLAIAIFVGFGLVILFLVVFVKRSMGDETTVDSSAVSRTLAQLNKERSSPEELAQQLFDAVRFGSYPQYRALFVTEHDAETFLSLEKLNSYLHGTMMDREVQKVFRRLTEICHGSQAKIRSVRTTEPVNLNTPSGAVVRMVSNAAVAVELPGGELGKIPCGSMVEINGKWKLFVPALADRITGTHDSVGDSDGPRPHAG